MQRIGIFGGSFNPVHNEHVKIAIGAVKELNLDKLFVMPTYVSPHKIGEDLLSGEDRLNMLKLAFLGVENIEISDYELSQKGVSYTYLTVLHFKKLYPNSKLYFILGSDMLEDFPTWKNPQIIVENANLVLLNREGMGENDSEAISKIKTLYNKGVISLKTKGLSVSSTEIRLRIKLNLDVSNLIDKKVENYLLKNNLFKADKYYNYINQNLPLKRKIHTLGVILTAIDFAKRLKESEKKAEISALLHDMAKYKTASEVKGFIPPSDCTNEVLHQFLGEYLARTELEIIDEDILNAIKYHTTGRANMSNLEKIVYVADLIEPSRTYEMVDYLRKVMKGDFEKGFAVCVKEVLDFLKLKGGEIYYLTYEAYKYYC